MKPWIATLFGIAGVTLILVMAAVLLLSAADAGTSPLLSLAPLPLLPAAAGAAARRRWSRMAAIIGVPSAMLLLHLVHGGSTGDLLFGEGILLGLAAIVGAAVFAVR